MRALASGALHAIRDNRNAWQIDADALRQWADKRSGPLPVMPRTTAPEPPRTSIEDRPETTARLAVAEARLADAIAERDRFAQLLAQALEPRPSIIDRIFGRGK